MPVKKIFTTADVSRIIVESEGRNSPVSGEPGHTLSRHMGQGGLQVSDRLRSTLGNSDIDHPIITDQHGAVVPEPQLRDIWKAVAVLNGGAQPSTNQVKAAYKELFESDMVSRSGSFLDAQVAYVIGKYVLNSPEGQAALDELDAGTARKPITKDISALDAAGGFTMNYSDRTDDVTHVEQFGKVFMLVDKLGADDIHIQTFFPIK